MPHDIAAWPSLLVATVMLRPYVFVFLASFLFLAGLDLGWRRAWGWLGWGWAVAFAAEYASTRVGVPFGLYHYTGETVGRELFLSNVPFFDPLSFPFLAYASYCLARWALGYGKGGGPAALAGLLMMALDVVVDPLAVLGERWFLGKVFYYAEPGAYFGVPLSNFAGWALVGWVIVAGWFRASSRRPWMARSPVGGVGLYYGILGVNLGITLSIGEWLLAGTGILVHVGVFLLLCRLKAKSAIRGWAEDEPPAGERVAVSNTTVSEGSLNP